jgi:hypothetical protein
MYRDIVLKRKLNRAKIPARLAINATCPMSAIILISVESFLFSASYLHLIIPSRSLRSLVPDDNHKPDDEKQDADIQKHNGKLPQI